MFLERTRLRTSPLTAALLALSAVPLNAQVLKVRVVDEPTRLGIGSAAVTLLRDDRTVAQAMSDTLGFFSVSISSSGIYVFRVEALGYIQNTREVELDVRSLVTMPAFVMQPRALALDSLVVTARANTRDPNVGFARRSQMLVGERIAALRSSGLWLESAIRQLNGLRVKSLGRGALCVESTRAHMSMTRMPQGYPGGTRQSNLASRCNMVVVIVNDLPEPDPDWLTSATLDNFESVEYYSPVEAGFRYGLEASARGALVFWTRGRGPHKTPNAWISPKK